MSQPVCIEAIALASPRIRPVPPDDPMRTMDVGERSVLRVKAIRIRNGRDWETASGRLTVTTEGRLLGVASGDRVRVTGLLSAPTPQLNPGEFDFAEHMRGRRELCRIRCDVPQCVNVVEHRAGWSLLAVVQAIRDRGDELLWQHLQHDRAGLAAAVLLGMREQVDPERMEHFMTTGTVHLLAISGLHVGILASGFWFLARFGWLSRRVTLMVAIALVVFYAMLTDARPPVVRAAILISVICIARLLGRRAFEFNTLGLAAIILLVLNPTNLFRTGTQLSFLAVASLACFQSLVIASARPADPLRRLIEQSRPAPLRIARACGSFCGRLSLASIVIWVVALPLVMYRFHLFSVAAVFLNPIVWLPMAFALFAGFGVLLFGWWLPPAASACGWLCDQNLYFIEHCVEVARQVPGNHAWVPAPPTWWVIGFYVGVTLAIAYPKLRPTRGWALVLVSSWFAIGFALNVGPVSRAATYEPRQLACTFVAVGHGTSVLVELPDGKTLLYDAGRLGSSKSGVRPIASALWSRGITHLDSVVLSHADADHYNAMPGVLDRFSVGTVYVSPMMFGDDSPALAALREAIEKRNVPLIEISSPSQLSGGEVELVILHPPDRGVAGSDNANSIVLEVKYRGRSILLPGDLETPGLEDVMSELPLDCDVIMAPHHGSMRSDPAGFSAWSTPETVVISGGAREGMDEIRAAYSRGGATVLHTAQDGAIRVVVGEAGVAVSRWQGKWQAAPSP